MTDAVAAVREFSRFYTEILGLLHAGLLDSPYSLTEVRVLFELGGPDPVGAAELRRRLDLDAGYLSRILHRLENDALIVRQRAADDARRQVVVLTPAGRDAFADLDARSSAQVDALLHRVDAADRHRLVAALDTARGILTGRPGPPAALLRPLRPGDLGWVVQHHGARYAAEYGWDVTFEGLVAGIVADYARSPHHARENAWIAEIDGEPVGSVFCVRHDDEVAQLRLLLVEPAARGAGLGGRLVRECVRFATAAGYRRLTLWTDAQLVAARRIYQQEGFHLVREGSHRSFGHDLTEQVWTRDLVG